MSEIIDGLALLQPFGNINYTFMSGCVCVETHHNVGDITSQVLFGLNWTNDDDNPDMWYHM